MLFKQFLVVPIFVSASSFAWALVLPGIARDDWKNPFNASLG